MANPDERKLALERLKVRKELKSAGEDELSDVIEREAQSRHTKTTSSVPAPARGLIAVLRELPPWSRPVVVIALLVFLAVTGMAVKVATGN